MSALTEILTNNKFIYEKNMKLDFVIRARKIHPICIFLLMR